ncbi:2-hydroxyhexa-2,4-dienoate hydratase [Variovorax sp. PBL-H6]|uniref:2-keto-4-pentenoate hydratase n=1 Tax=Variovorax sp. PBL-H6 TaxID=434009 RepID=UPI001316443C|nr:hydratase [Variovorax sp. PBL-H6]VTU18944.1 2-hydroxyhexa-2,4-dienoate hydratase [Variovorax sp. PBL-H6]
MDRGNALLQASEILWNEWQHGTVIPSLSGDCRPSTRAEGYQVQAAIEARSAGPLFGWKIAATSPAGQRHINVKGPIAGRLLRERVHASGSRLSLARNRMAVAEPEFAFRMRCDLPPKGLPYSKEEVLAATASLHPAIEVPDSRFVDFTIVGEAQLIADNACAHDFILGDPAPNDWRTMDLSQHQVRGQVSGAARSYLREGSGAAVLGNPLDALVWLVNELSSLGITLHSGQVVTTGACTVPLEVLPGDTVVAGFGPCGTVFASFSD